MSKFSLAERQFIKSIVASASLKRMTDNEVIEEIQKHTDKEPVSREYLYSIRKSIKKEAFNWYSKMREGKYDYIHEFKERINEVYWLQKKHYQIIQSDKEPTAIKQTSLAELARLNIILANYLDVLPEIIGNNHNATIPTTPKESTAPPTRESITV